MKPPTSTPCNKESLRLVGNGVSRLLHQSIFRFKPLQGSVTRSQAWKRLQNNGRVAQNMLIKGQQRPRRKILTSKLSALEKKLGRKSVQTSLMRSETAFRRRTIFSVADTSQRNDFPYIPSILNSYFKV